MEGHLRKQIAFSLAQTNGNSV